MGRLKVLSGDDVGGILGRVGFQVVGQRGSHVKVRRVVQGSRQTLTIPRHATLDAGTLRAIYRQALRYVPEDWLTRHCYDQDA